MEEEQEERIESFGEKREPVVVIDSSGRSLLMLC